MNFLFASSLLIAAVLSLLPVVSGDRSMVLSSKQECDPNKSTFRMAGDTDRQQCGHGMSCVLNGHSSLGGYCYDHSIQNGIPMEWPEVRRELCFICGNPENDGSQYVVTKSWELVGNHMCLEIDGLGREGRIMGSQCKIFQQMIHENDLCGCTKVSGTGEALFSEDISEDVPEEDPQDVAEEAIVPPAEQSSSEDFDYPEQQVDVLSLSGGSSRMISVTGVASSVIALLLAFY